MYRLLERGVRERDYVRTSVLEVPLNYRCPHEQYVLHSIHRQWSNKRQKVCLKNRLSYLVDEKNFAGMLSELHLVCH